MPQPKLDADIQNVQPTVIAIRRDLHAHPELGFQEYRTAGVVADRLRALGLEPETGIAETGVMAMLTGGAGDGPTVLLRADMDALPITEETDEPFRSLVPGVMHACGHDGHTAMLLGLAEVLVGRRERLRGRVKFVFQPAEETPGGARPMIEAGVLADPPVDYAFGIHLWAPLPTGTVAVSPGPIMASSDTITITVRGSGGHAAIPSQTVDPVLVASHLVCAAQSIVSRNVPALDAAVLSVTQFHAGDTFNVIPDVAVLNGTVRSFDAAVQQRVETRLRELCDHLPAGFGASAELDYRRGYPVTVNDEQATAWVAAAAAEVVGERGVLSLEPILGAEDFAYFLREVSGCFFMVGVRNEAKGTGAPHHNPRFRLDEDAFAVGMQTMLNVVGSLLA